MFNVAIQHNDLEKVLYMSIKRLKSIPKAIREIFNNGHHWSVQDILDEDGMKVNVDENYNIVSREPYANQFGVRT